MFADSGVLENGLLAKLNKEVSGVQAALWLTMSKKMSRTMMTLTVRQLFHCCVCLVRMRRFEL